MRNILLGSLLILVGIFLLAYAFVSQGNLAQQGGGLDWPATAATIVGHLLIGIGGYYLVRGVMEAPPESEHDLIYTAAQTIRRPRRTADEWIVDREAEPDDEEETDEGEVVVRPAVRRLPIAHASPLPWILGGFGLAFLALVGSGLVYCFVLFPNQPSLSPNALALRSKAIGQWGKDRVATVLVRGLSKPGQHTAVAQRLRALTGVGGVSGIGEGDDWVFVVGPVPDLEGYVQRIDFGSVTIANRRLRYLIIDVDEAKLPDAPAWPPRPPAWPPAAGGFPGVETKPQINPPKPPPSAAGMRGLILYYDFDGQGDTVADLAGGKNPSKLIGLTRVRGIRGQAIEFAGKGTYLDYGDSATLNFAAAASFTFAFWVRTKDSSATLLCQRKQGVDSPLIRICVTQFGMTAEVRRDAPGRAPFPATVRSWSKINDDQWHHLALTREGNSIELFMDGSSAGQAASPYVLGPITTDLRALGEERYETVHGLPKFYPNLMGAIDEFCIFNRVLGGEEIKSLAGR